MKSTKRPPALPIGRAATLAFQISAARAGCSKTAAVLLRQPEVDEAELEECARLDEAMERAERILKCSVREIMLSRLHRRSRRTRAK